MGLIDTIKGRFKKDNTTSEKKGKRLNDVANELSLFNIPRIDNNVISSADVQIPDFTNTDANNSYLSDGTINNAVLDNQPNNIKTVQGNNTGIFNDIALKDPSTALKTEEGVNEQPRYEWLAYDTGVGHFFTKVGTKSGLFTLLDKVTGADVSERAKKDVEDLKTSYGFFDSMNDAIEQKKNKKLVAIGYDEDNDDVLYVDFDKDNRNAENRFNELVDEYNSEMERIGNSDISDYEKYIQMSQAQDNFENQGIKLLKIEGDDWYDNSYGLYGALRGIGRRKNMYTDEQLDMLKSNGVKNGDEVPRSIFWDFVNANEQNKQYTRTLSEIVGNIKDESDNRYLYELTGDSVATAQGKQVDKALGKTIDNINGYLNSGLIDADERSAYANAAINAASSEIEHMWEWMQTAVAYYKLVQTKDPSTLTSGEKRVLEAGPIMETIMDKYTNALGDVIYESSKQGLVDGKFTGIADSINGQSITDYLYNSIAPDAQKIIGTFDTGISLSAIDLMQQIGNKVSYDYWEGKGGDLRQTWQEVERGLGQAGFLASEAGKTTVSQVADWVGADTLADYINADSTTLMLLTTDGSKRQRAVREYGLKAAENVPELAGNLYLTSKFVPGLSAAKGGSRLGILGRVGKTSTNKFLKGIYNTERKLSRINRFENITDRIRKSVGSTQKAGGVRQWIGQVSNAGGPVNLLINQTSNKATLSTAYSLLGNITKGVLSDQVIDGLASYYDTEAYSTPSYIFSVGLTGLTEIAIPYIGSRQFATRFKNLINGERYGLGTVWDFARYLDGDEEVYKKVVQNLGGAIRYDDLKMLTGQFRDVEIAVSNAFMQLDGQAKDGLNRLTKQQLYDRLTQLKNLDWSSQLGVNLRSLINNKDANIADMMKYVLGIPNEQEISIAGMVSTIKIKDGSRVASQTRTLLTDNAGNAYADELDRIDGQFRRKLSKGFTKQDIQQIKDRTSYKDVIDDNGKINSDMFAWDSKAQRYFLTTDGATKFDLKISDYTDALKNLDILQAETKDTEKFLTQKLKKILGSKGVDKEIVSQLTDSGAYNTMFNTLKEELC